MLVHRVNGALREGASGVAAVGLEEGAARVESLEDLGELAVSFVGDWSFNLVRDGLVYFEF